MAWCGEACRAVVRPPVGSHFEVVSSEEFFIYYCRAAWAALTHTIPPLPPLHLILPLLSL